MRASGLSHGGRVKFMARPCRNRPRRLEDSDIRVLGQLGDAGPWHDVEHIDVAGLKGADAARWLGNEGDLDGVEERAPTIPAVERDQLEPAAEVGRVGHDGKGAGADRRLRKLVRTHLLEGTARDWASWRGRDRGRRLRPGKGRRVR